MKLFLSVLLGFATAAFALPQQAAMKDYYISFDSLRNQTLHETVTAVVYYPGFGISEKVPLIVFCHGWGGAGHWYEFFAASLVPYGYVVASVDWSRTLDNSPENMAANQEFLVKAIIDQSDNNQSSPIYQMLNGKAATSGHSNGGAASTISTAQQGPSVWQSMLTLSAAFCSTCQQVAKNITQPVMVMTATKDCVCPPPQNAYPLYNEIKSSCKYLVNLMNGTHCQFWEDKGPIENWGCLEILEHSCYPDHIPIHQQFALVSKYALPWYDYTLKGRDRLSLLDSMLTADAEDGVLIWEKQC